MADLEDLWEEKKLKYPTSNIFKDKSNFLSNLDKQLIFSWKK